MNASMDTSMLLPFLVVAGCLLAFLRRELPESLAKIRLAIQGKASGAETHQTARVDRNQFTS